MVFRDITERRRMEREQAALHDERARVLVRERDARAELERASQLKDEFLAVLSHELRTPLNAVLGYAHLLNEGKLPPERTRHATEAIQRNAEAQARLVESLLDLSRIMAGKLELNLEALDLWTVADTALDVVRPDAEAKSITLAVAEPRTPVSVVGDSGRLQQVFWNLLSNAVKFAPRGGEVVIGVKKDDDRARITVADNGQGIGSDFLPHVFDRFKQAASAARSAGGLGLGLALVREMVQAHGGTVAADSRGPPAMLLADLGMPEEDGYSLIRKVRARERDQSATALPAIAVTAFATVADREQAIAAGYDAHVSKPVDADALTRIIQSMLSQRASDQP